MTDLEFIVLDELYFLTNISSLESNTSMPTKELLLVLDTLLAKGYLRCYTSPDEELELRNVNIIKNGHTYLYLASKSGLLAHNSL